MDRVGEKEGWDLGNELREPTALRVWNIVPMTTYRPGAIVGEADWRVRSRGSEESSAFQKVSTEMVFLKKKPEDLFMI